MLLTVASTLPHYAAIWPLALRFRLGEFRTYCLMIFTSSTLSVIWHLNEGSFALMIIDYIGAAVWCFSDIVSLPDKRIAILSNLVIFVALWFLDHRIWHLLSAAKAFWLASLLARVETRGISDETKFHLPY
jgi:hypothetical protein